MLNVELEPGKTKRLVHRPMNTHGLPMSPLPDLHIRPLFESGPHIPCQVKYDKLRGCIEITGYLPGIAHYLIGMTWNQDTGVISPATEVRVAAEVITVVVTEGTKCINLEEI